MSNTNQHEPILYIMLKPLAVLLFSIIFLPRVRGRKNIPQKGAAVLAGNHTKSLDCFMVMAGTRRCVHFLAKAEIFKPGFLCSFFKSAGLIPVHRERKDPDALKSAKEFLSDGKVVGIFPEGKVNKTDEKLLPFRIGAVKMAHDTSAVIVPFTITGRYIPFFGGITITFGKAYSVNSENLTDENDKLRKKVSDEYY